jgi:hypothetical protein
MSETKFTKGDWAVRPHGELRFNVCVLSKGVSVYSSVKAVNDATFDAHLIATAPEMYDFIKKVFDTQKNHYGYAMELHMAMIKLAEESELLLAKARGEL